MENSRISMLASLDQAIEDLEKANQALAGEDPGAMEQMECAAHKRAQAIDAVVALLATSQPTIGQVSRLRRIYLSGILSMHRIEIARQAMREDLRSLIAQGHALSGYRSNSSARP
jgi:hypothetical protein